MCGIIGIASYKDISKEILESLKKLVGCAQWNY